MRPLYSFLQSAFFAKVPKAHFFVQLVSQTFENLAAKNIECHKILLQKNIITKKNIEYNELKAWLAQARQQAASTTASQMAFDASWKTGHLPLLEQK